MLYGFKGRRPEKSCCSFGFCLNYMHPSPQFEQFVQLYLNAKYVDLSGIQTDSISNFFLKKARILALWVVYTVYNLKNSLKFKLLALGRKQTPFIDQKCTYKSGQKFGQGPPPPLIWTKLKRTATFFREAFP